MWVLVKIDVGVLTSSMNKCTGDVSVQLIIVAQSFRCWMELRY